MNLGGVAQFLNAHGGKACGVGEDHSVVAFGPVEFELAVLTSIARDNSLASVKLPCPAAKEGASAIVQKNFRVHRQCPVRLQDDAGWTLGLYWFGGDFLIALVEVKHFTRPWRITVGANLKAEGVAHVAGQIRDEEFFLEEAILARCPPGRELLVLLSLPDFEFQNGLGAVCVRGLQLQCDSLISILAEMDDLLGCVSPQFHRAGGIVCWRDGKNNFRIGRSSPDHSTRSIRFTFPVQEEPGIAMFDRAHLRAHEGLILFSQQAQAQRRGPRKTEPHLLHARRGSDDRGCGRKTFSFGCEHKRSCVTVEQFEMAVLVIGEDIRSGVVIPAGALFQLHATHWFSRGIQYDAADRQAFFKREHGLFFLEVSQADLFGSLERELFSRFGSELPARTAGANDFETETGKVRRTIIELPESFSIRHRGIGFIADDGGILNEVSSA